MSMQLALAGDSLAVVDVELRLAERGRHLVLDHLDLGARPHHGLPVLQRRDPADVDADRGIELQGAAAGRRLGVAEHDADLFADLVDEDQARLRLGDDRGQLAQGLGHQARLQAHLRLAHLSFDLGLGHQGRDRVDDDHVDRAGADQHLGDFERLFAVVRLGDEQVLGLDAELLGVLGVERMLGVDERREAPGLLRLGDDLEGERGLAGRLGAEDLDDAAPRDPAHTQGGVHRQGAGRDHRDRNVGLVSQPHDRALAELPLDLGERRLDGAPFFAGFLAGHVLAFLAYAKCESFRSRSDFRAMRTIIVFGNAAGRTAEDGAIIAPRRARVNGGPAPRLPAGAGDDAARDRPRHGALSRRAGDRRVGPRPGARRHPLRRHSRPLTARVWPRRSDS